MSLAQLSGSLPPDLAQQAQLTERVARGYGLDFFPVVFQLLDARDVNGVAAYGGFPVRYPSWRHGMEFERLDKGYTWGLSKIYELVINNDPVVAYLVKSNSRLEQKLVMAHVFGHADFFRHNCWFAATERHMLDRMGSHSTRVRRHIDRHGLERVERFLDLALSLETLVDPYLPLRTRLAASEAEQPAGGSAPYVESLSSGRGTFDLLGFLAEDERMAGRLEPWQTDLLRIVRAEAYYFQPQRMTKIMNEGWATFWHSRMLTEGLLDSSEIVDFADCHSSATVQGPGRLNPYKLGLELFRYAHATDRDVFRLRRIHNDASFVDELLDEAFIERHELFVYGPNQRSGRSEVGDRDWKRVKAQLLSELSWGGLPQIELVGVDLAGEGELKLQHRHDGRDLQLAQAQDTASRLSAVWGGPVHLHTLEEGQGRLLRCDGDEVEVIDTPEGREVVDETPDVADAEATSGRQRA